MINKKIQFKWCNGIIDRCFALEKGTIISQQKYVNWRNTVRSESTHCVFSHEPSIWLEWFKDIVHHVTLGMTSIENRHWNSAIAVAIGIAVAIAIAVTIDIVAIDIVVAINIAVVINIAVAIDIWTLIQCP